MHYYEDYRALADTEPQDSQRQQRHTGQQVADRHYQIVDRMEYPVHYGKSGKHECQHHGYTHAFYDKRHRIKRVLQQAVVLKACDKTAADLLQRREQQLRERLHLIHHLPYRQKTNDKNDLCPYFFHRSVPFNIIKSQVAQRLHAFIFQKSVFLHEIRHIKHALRLRRVHARRVVQPS